MLENGDAFGTRVTRAMNPVAFEHDLLTDSEGALPEAVDASIVEVVALHPFLDDFLASRM